MATCGSLTWPKQVVLSEWAYTLKHHQHIVKQNDSYDSYDIMTLKEMEGVGAAKRSGRLCRRGSLKRVLLPRAQEEAAVEGLQSDEEEQEVRKKPPEGKAWAPWARWLDLNMSWSHSRGACDTGRKRPF